MTENRRIFWNIVATYGRSLFSLVCGLFTARWALNALGVTDYGLVGVVGGLTVFIGFLNGTLSSAIARFYAISIGQQRSAPNKDLALEESRRWFNIALSVHTVVPVILILIGYPIGTWVIRNFLTIPLDRVEDCVWVFRFSCFTCFVGMVNVAFGAMYGAKQYIAELTIYSYITTVLNVIFMYYMISHPGVWMVRYSLWGCALSVIPQTIICMRALCIFPECKVRLAYMWDIDRLKRVIWFAWWNFCGMVCGVLRIQGVAILVNKTFGPNVNAANALGNSVNGHTASLSSSMMGAFLPAITTAYGAGDMDRMRMLVFRACKFGCLLLMIFIVPLIAELHNVLVIWLKNPPKYTTWLCFVAIVTHFMDVSTLPHCVAINASGRVKEYQTSMIKISILTLPLAILIVWLGGGIYALGVLLIAVRISISLRRVYHGRRLATLSGRRWFFSVVIPVSFVGIITMGGACIPRLFMTANFARIIVTTVLSETILFLVGWMIALDKEERMFVQSKVKDAIVSLVGRKVLPCA